MFFLYLNIAIRAIINQCFQRNVNVISPCRSDVCLKRNVCNLNSFQVSQFSGNVLTSGVRDGPIKEPRKSVHLAHFRLLLLLLGRSNIGISTNVGSHFRT
jgi:hypothetical protein